VSGRITHVGALFHQMANNLGGPSLASIYVEWQLMRCARFTTHIELENTGNHDNGLRPVSVLKHCKPDRLGTIDEESAAYAAMVLNNPDPPAILADQEERRSRTRGRFCLSHCGCP
jgi:hypothetical protein